MSTRSSGASSVTVKLPASCTAWLSAALTHDGYYLAGKITPAKAGSSLTVELPRTDACNLYEYISLLADGAYWLHPVFAGGDCAHNKTVQRALRLAEERLGDALYGEARRTVRMLWRSGGAKLVGAGL
jgi:hypothetical protein